jgi:hypothetical protein
VADPAPLKETPTLEMRIATDNATKPGGLVLRLRGRQEAETYAASRYPWLAQVILPDALYKLARDIMFEETP